MNPAHIAVDLAESVFEGAGARGRAPGGMRVRPSLGPGLKRSVTGWRCCRQETSPATARRHDLGMARPTTAPTAKPTAAPRVPPIR